MSMSFQKPIFTSCTPISAAQVSRAFTVTWTYPTDFNSYATTTNTSGVLYYELYRHIERKYPPALANGGPSNDPADESDNLPYFLIAPRIAPSTLTYTDTLNDMSVHASEGIVWNSSQGKWLDGAGNDVVAEILSAQRRIYYKIRAVTSTTVFNSLPFLFVAYSDGIRCKSTCTQVKNNVLYAEGETVWFNSASVLHGRTRIAVDIVSDSSMGRYNNVWASGNNKIVYCLNGITGEIIRSYTIAGISNIKGIRVDLDTGDAIVIRNILPNDASSNIYRCVLRDGTITLAGNTNQTTPPPDSQDDNNGLVLTNENGTTYSHCIYSKDIVVKNNIDNGKLTNVKARENFGCASQPYFIQPPRNPTPTENYNPSNRGTLKGLRNVVGITNGPDNSVWVTGHVPIWDFKNVTSEYPYNYLQDIGYVYGANDNNLSISNQTYEYPRTYPAHGIGGYTYRPFTSRFFNNRCYANGGWEGIGDAGRMLHGVIIGIPNKQWKTTRNPNEYFQGKPYSNESEQHPVPDGFGNGQVLSIGIAAESNDIRPISLSPPESQRGMATDCGGLGLSSTNYNIWVTNRNDKSVSRLTYNANDRSKELGYTVTDNMLNRPPISETCKVPDGDPNFLLPSTFSLSCYPIHVAVDSEEHVWILSENASISKIYQITNYPNTTNSPYNYIDSSFPNNGGCTWPALFSTGSTNPNALNQFGVTLNYIYGTGTNNPYIEFALTRSSIGISVTTDIITVGDIKYYGTRIVGATIDDQIAAAKAWCITGTNYKQAGRRLYPNYKTTTTTFRTLTANIATESGRTIAEYNSDNTGMSMLYNRGNINTPADYIHPLSNGGNGGQIHLHVKKVTSDPSMGDNNFWNLNNHDSTNFHSTSGYDSLTVELSAVTDINPADYDGFVFVYHDKVRDIGSTIDNPLSSDPIFEYSTTYTYDDPSQSGKPLHRHHDVGITELYKCYKPTVKFKRLTDCYYLDGDTITDTESTPVSVYVWERWPTSIFYTQPYDTSALRHRYLSGVDSWNLTSYDFPVGNNELAVTDENMIISGYDPLSVVFNDMSISRTWPIAEWHWTFGDQMTYLGKPIDTFGGAYPHVINSIVYTANPPTESDQYDVVHEHIESHLYRGPGTYYATLWVAASNSQTDSWNIVQGVTSENVMSNTFIISTVRRIDVLEVCPVVSFTLISSTNNPLSAYTVPSNYSDDGAISYVPAVYNNYGAFATNGMISGYAPNLTIGVSGTLNARSLPIVSASWDFGDAYVNEVASDTINVGSIEDMTGWPNWNTDTAIVTGRHTYVMPGFYNISLNPIVSSLSEDYVSHCNNSDYTNYTKTMAVYVKEIPLTANMGVGTSLTNFGNVVVSGVAPFTIYAHASATRAGSFPICRLDWDFGDGSPITTISRVLSSEYSKYFNRNFHPTDHYDPRNLVVSHVYEGSTVDEVTNYVISLSAYACNTNSVDTVDSTSSTISYRISANKPSTQESEGDIHLIGTRMYNQDNDILMSFEGETSKTLYNVLLSSVRL